MLTLGIDPGTAIMGYGLVRNDEGGGNLLGGNLTLVEYGALTTPAGMPLPKRLAILYRGLSDLIERYRPDAAAIEELFFNKNTRTALAVGQARGVALLACEHAGIAIYEYTPLEVKQALSGYGRASKEQIQEMVRLTLQLRDIPHPDDAADALAIAICHSNTAGFNQLIEFQVER